MAWQPMAWQPMDGGASCTNMLAQALRAVGERIGVGAELNLSGVQMLTQVHQAGAVASG